MEVRGSAARAGPIADGVPRTSEHTEFKLTQEDKEDFRDRRAALPVLALDVECEL